MNALPLSYRISSSLHDSPLCNLVLLHDHPLAASATEGLLSPLLERCLSEPRIHWDRWSFEELDHAEFRSEALELARPCDLMVLATIHPSLPGHVTSWITSWTETRTQKEAALIYLTATSNAEVFGVISQQLQDFQNSGNLTVFVSRLSLPSFRSSLSAPEGRRSSAFRSWVPRPEGWGINE